MPPNDETEATGQPAKAQANAEVGTSPGSTDPKGPESPKRPQNPKGKEPAKLHNWEKDPLCWMRNADKIYFLDYMNRNGIFTHQAFMQDQQCITVGKFCNGNQESKIRSSALRIIDWYGVKQAQGNIRFTLPTITHEDAVEIRGRYPNFPLQDMLRSQQEEKGRQQPPPANWQHFPQGFQNVPQAGWQQAPQNHGVRPNLPVPAAGPGHFSQGAQPMQLPPAPGPFQHPDRMQFAPAANNHQLELLQSSEQPQPNPTVYAAPQGPHAPGSLPQGPGLLAPAVSNFPQGSQACSQPFSPASGFLQGAQQLPPAPAGSFPHMQARGLVESCEEQGFQQLQPQAPDDSFPSMQAMSELDFQHFVSNFPKELAPATGFQQGFQQLAPAPDGSFPHMQAMGDFPQQLAPATGFQQGFQQLATAQPGSSRQGLGLFSPAESGHSQSSQQVEVAAPFQPDAQTPSWDELYELLELPEICTPQGSDASQSQVQDSAIVQSPLRPDPMNGVDINMNSNLTIDVNMDWDAILGDNQEFTNSLTDRTDQPQLGENAGIDISQLENMFDFDEQIDGSSPSVNAMARRKRKHGHQAVRPNLLPPLQTPGLLSQSSSLPSTGTVDGMLLVNSQARVPDRLRLVFPFQFFNQIQSACFQPIYESTQNVVVAAPTGSGKTALLELAICKLAADTTNTNAKIVYVGPTKALCKEKTEDWEKKFKNLNMPVVELTGDTSRAQMRNVREAKIIVTTPEKWDSITRSWSDHRKLLGMIELFLIDEVHILKESRGATLEAIVSRMKTYGSKVRFLALSATVPNSEDIAVWLGKDHAHPDIPAYRQVFGEEYRPVKLLRAVYGFDSKLGDFPFDAFLNSQLWNHLARHSQKKPVLVFCMTRKSCQDAAAELAKQWSQRQPQDRLWPEPKRRIPVVDPQLQKLVRYGVAFHHAGLDTEDRKAVHRAFEEGHISVICCTSTLAVGINLPCHTVVLKGTVGYQDGGQLSEYSDLEVMQMLGRAGRPQFGHSAFAIILTRSRNKKRYEELESGQQILESTLHKNLIEHLNSELSLGTFSAVEGAKKWLRGTFLSVRLSRHPEYYRQLFQETLRNGDSMTSDGLLQEICLSAMERLRNTRLIEGTKKLQSTEYGRAMSKYMIRFDTMKMILNISAGVDINELLSSLCEAGEFGEIRWQTNEREQFRDINKDHFILYPISGMVSTVAHKVSLLIQMELGRVEASSIAGLDRKRIRSETSRVFEVMNRLIRAVIECKGADLDGKSCWASLVLARSMAARAWEGKTVQLLQVPQVGVVLMRKFVSSNIKSVANLASAEASTIERIASRNPPFGKKMLDCLATFPRLTLHAKVKHRGASSNGRPVVHVDATLGFTSSFGKWNGRIPILTFLAVTTQGVSAYFWRDSLKALQREEDGRYVAYFTWNPCAVGEELVCRLACEDVVGTAVSTSVKHNLPASAFPARPFEAVLPVSGTVKTEDEADFPSLDTLSGGVDDEDIFSLMDQSQSYSDEKLHLDNYKKAKKKPLQSLPTASTVECKIEDDTEDTVPGTMLPNGRFRCAHPCSQVDGGTTARGKQCGHDCCQNGSKKPPKKSASGTKRKASDSTLAVPGSTQTAVWDTPKSKPAAKHKKTGKVVSSQQPGRAVDFLQSSELVFDEDGMVDLTMADAQHSGSECDLSSLFDDLGEEDFLAIADNTRDMVVQPKRRRVHDELHENAHEPQFSSLWKDDDDDMGDSDGHLPDYIFPEQNSTSLEDTAESPVSAGDVDSQPATTIKKDPEWVNDFDADFIDEFRGFVDFR